MQLIDKGSEALSQLELLEILLFAGNRRIDAKLLAELVMRRFSSLSAVLRAPGALLAQQSGVGDASIAALKIIKWRVFN